MKFVIGLLSGSLFGLGLVVAQMTDPRRITGFLDLFGAWDPRLAFVMMGAIAVHAPFFFWSRRHAQPRHGTGPSDIARERIDRRLVVGAAIFGVGWGLAGYCPGPAIVAAARGGAAAVLAVSMVVGMWIFEWTFERPKQPTRGATQAARPVIASGTPSVP